MVGRGRHCHQDHDPQGYRESVHEPEPSPRRRCRTPTLALSAYIVEITNRLCRPGYRPIRSCLALPAQVNGALPPDRGFHRHAKDQIRLRLLRLLLPGPGGARSEEHTSELQSLMRTSSAVFSLTTKNTK